MLNLKAIIPIVVFAGLCVALALGLTRDPSKLPSQLIDKPFPEFQLTSLYSEAESLDKDLLRGQVSVVNVFGSWCTACEYEHPVLMDLSATQDVPIIGINWRDSRAKGQGWLARHGNPYAAVIYDPESVLAIDLGITGAPESFVVDASGTVRYKHTGVITPRIWERDILPVIEALKAGDI